MDLRLNGKTALVATGAGLAIATRLAAEGASGRPR
jgi:hypothetical protein